MTLRLCVRVGLSGEACDVEVPGNSLLPTVKELICSTTSIPPAQQKLLVGQHIVDDLSRTSSEQVFVDTVPGAREALETGSKFEIRLVKRTHMEAQVLKLLLDQSNILRHFSWLIDHDMRLRHREEPHAPGPWAHWGPEMPPEFEEMLFHWRHFRHRAGLRDHREREPMEVDEHRAHERRMLLEHFLLRHTMPPQELERIQMLEMGRHGLVYSLQSGFLAAVARLLPLSTEQEFLELDSILGSPDVMRVAVTQISGHLLQIATDGVKDNRGLVLAAVRQNGLALEHARGAAREDRDVVLAAVQENGMALRFAPEELRADEEIVAAAVAQNVEAFNLASHSVNNKEAVIMAAIALPSDINARAAQVRAAVFRNASESLRQDRDFVIRAIKVNWRVLGHVLPEHKSDRDICLVAAARCGEALTLVDPSLRSDKEFILATVNKNGSALQHSTSESQEDEQVVLAAVAHCPGAMQYASYKLKTDLAFVKEVVKTNRAAFKYAIQAKSLAIEIMHLDGLALAFASPPLRADPDVVLAAVAQTGAAFQHAATELKTDPAVVLAAAELDRHAVSFAQAQLRKGWEAFEHVVAAWGVSDLRPRFKELVSYKPIVLQAVAREGLALEWVPDDLLEDRDVVISAFWQGRLELQKCSARLRGHKTVVLEAIHCRGDDFQHATEELKSDRRFVFEAVVEHHLVLKHAAETLQKDWDMRLALLTHHALTLEGAFDNDEALPSAKRIRCKEPWSEEMVAEMVRARQDKVQDVLKQIRAGWRALKKVTGTGDLAVISCRALQYEVRKAAAAIDPAALLFAEWPFCQNTRWGLCEALTADCHVRAEMYWNK